MHSLTTLMNMSEADRRKYVEQRFQEAVQDAATLGFVVTVEQKPLAPLAMGHHETVVSVRAARK